MGSVKPYYQDDLVTLYHGDCLEVTEWLAADVLVTDPPYGLGGKLGFGSTETHKWDASLAVRDAALALWGEKPRAVFGSPRRLDAAPPHREVPLIWDKGNVVAMGDTSFPWRPTYELIYVGGHGWSGPRGEAVLRSQHSSSASSIGHPTPKPVGLLEALINKAPAGLIADPFAGAGSTLIAARNLGRRAIGIELEERYCELIVKRLAQQVFDFGETA